MARIVTAMMTSNYLRNMNNNLNNMSTLQKQLSTGKKVSRPSDNPYTVRRTMQLYKEISSNDQYNTNIKDVSNWLDATDTALGQLNNVLARIRELQIKAGNGTYDSEEHSAIQVEIKEKITQVVDILNSNFDGNYIFGGAKSTSKPVKLDSNGKIQYADKEGNEVFPIKDTNTNKTITDIVKYRDKDMVIVKYTDDSTTPATEKEQPVELTLIPPDSSKTESQILRENLNSKGIFSADINKKLSDTYTIINNHIGADLNVEISQGVLENYNKTAVDILTYKDSSGNVKSLPDLLNNIIYNLNDPNITNSNADLDKVSGEYVTEMDFAISNLLKNRSEVGAISNSMETCKINNEKQNESMTTILANTEDIDWAEAMMEYSILQTVYTASLQVSAKILPTTILNYL